LQKCGGGGVYGALRGHVSNEGPIHSKWSIQFVSRATSKKHQDDYLQTMPLGLK